MRAKNALTIYEAVTSWAFTAQEKEKEKKNVSESVRCYFRTRNSILGDSKEIIL